MSETATKTEVKLEDLHTYEQFTEVLAAGLPPEQKRNLQKRVSNLLSRGKLTDKEGRALIMAAEGMGGSAQKEIDSKKPLSERAELDNRGKVVIPFAMNAGFGPNGVGFTPDQWTVILDNADEIRKGVARVVEECPNWKQVYELHSDVYKARRIAAAAAAKAK